MKVLMLNGSPRKDGNTSIALEEMKKIFEAEGVETEIVVSEIKMSEAALPVDAVMNLENVFLMMLSMNWLRNLRRQMVL